MTIEMIESREISYLETLTDVASRSGPKMEGAIEEFLQAVEDGKIKIFFKKAVLMRTIVPSCQEPGVAHLFLPLKHSPDQAERELVFVLKKTLAITRRLSVPELGTMDKFVKELRREQEELVMSPQLW